LNELYHWNYYRLSLAENPDLVELWHVDTKRCVMTRAGAPPPFVVDLYDGDTLLSHTTFPYHDLAVAHAVNALRRAVPAN
jgi:hypothetical protein